MPKIANAIFMFSLTFSGFYAVAQVDQVKLNPDVLENLQALKVLSDLPDLSALETLAAAREGDTDSLRSNRIALAQALTEYNRARTFTQGRYSDVIQDFRAYELTQDWSQFKTESEREQGRIGAAILSSRLMKSMNLSLDPSMLTFGQGAKVQFHLIVRSAESKANRVLKYRDAILKAEGSLQ